MVKYLFSQKSNEYQSKQVKRDFKFLTYAFMEKINIMFFDFIEDTLF